MNRRNRLLCICVLFAALIFAAACDGLTMPEFPDSSRLEADVRAYMERRAGEQVGFYTLRVRSKTYERKTAEVEYLCRVQYSWLADPDTVFTDDFSLRYQLSSAGLWTTDHCEGAAFSVRLETKPQFVRYLPLFYQPVDGEEGLIASAAESALRPTDVLYDFAVVLDGTVYRLPCSYRDLAADGWTLTEANAYTALDLVFSHTYGMVEMERNGTVIVVYTVNWSERDLPIAQCDVEGFRISSGNGAFTLPGGITEKSTADAILASYGAPDADTVNNGERTISYVIYEQNTSVVFHLTDAYTSVEMLNFSGYEPERAYASISDVYSVSVALDQVTYPVPCPMQLFLDNGWTIRRGGLPEDWVRWYAPVECTLEKGGQRISVLAETGTNNDRALAACSVIRIRCDSKECDYRLTDTVSAASSRAEILSSFGTPTAASPTGKVILYYAFPDEKQVAFTMGASSTSVELSAEGEHDDFRLFDYFSFSIELAGRSFELPLTVQSFTEQGWFFACKANEIVAAGTWGAVDATTTRGERVRAYVCNPTAQDAPVSACLIGGISVDTEVCSITLSGGIGRETTADALKNAYGLPQFEKTENGVYTAAYLLSHDRFVRFDIEKDIVQRIQIVNFTF